MPRRMRARRSPGEATTASDPRHQRHADSGEDDLEQQLDPVEALGVGDADGPGDHGAQKGGHDTDDDREPDRDVLPAGYDQATQHTDDQTDDQRGNDAGDSHGVSSSGGETLFVASVSPRFPSAGETKPTHFGFAPVGAPGPETVRQS